MAEKPKAENKKQVESRRALEIIEPENNKNEPPVLPEPPISRPPDPSTAGIPQADLNQFEAQRQLGYDEANTAYTTTMGKADGDKSKAEGVWNSAVTTFRTGRESAFATARTDVQKAVLAYNTSIAGATETCPDKPPSDLDLMIFWLTLDSAVDGINAQLETGLGALEAAYKTAQGVWRAVEVAFDRTSQSAKYTRDKGCSDTDKAYWVSVQKARIT